MPALVTALLLLLNGALGFVLLVRYRRRVPVHGLYGTRYEIAYVETIVVRAAGLIMWLVCGYEFVCLLAGSP